MSDLQAMDALLNLTEILNEADRNDLDQSSFRHPYDLSQNHSGAIDYNDDSEEEALTKLPVQVRDDEYSDESDDDAQSSVIMSDLSFENRLKELDDDRDEAELLKIVANKMQR